MNGYDFSQIEENGKVLRLRKKTKKSHFDDFQAFRFRRDILKPLIGAKYVQLGVKCFNSNIVSSH
jgi:hypothetical protein